MNNSHYTILSPEDFKLRNIYIDKQFRNEILLHFIKNHIPSLNSPLILAIQGNRGEGKTEQIKEYCISLGFTIILLHGSSIGGKHENEPADILKRAYLEASKIMRSGKQCVLFIDDIDTSIASTHNDRNYTVNSQLVNGTLMSLANNPYNIGEVETNRVPLIFTGNNLTNLYAPLTRDGRMKIYSWIPSYEAKCQIIRKVFSDCLDESKIELVDKLVEEHKEKPIAFFVDIKNELFNEVILKKARQIGSIDFNLLRDYIENARFITTVEELLEIANQKSLNTLKNFN